MSPLAMLLAASVLTLGDPDEKWWGTFVSNGWAQPYCDSEPYDLEKVNFGCATASLLVSSEGRYVWGSRPYILSATDGVVTLESKYEDLRVVKAGDTLKDAFLAAARLHFPSDGRMPPREFFEEPQFNSYIETCVSGGGQAGVERYIADLDASGFPCGVFMIDAGWEPCLGVFEFNGRFSAPKRLFGTIRERGWKSLVWASHFVSPDNGVFGRLRYEPHFGGLDLLCHRKADSQPAIVRWWAGASAVFDLTNPAGYRYFADALTGFTRRYGIDGIKFDAGDQPIMYADGDIRFHDEGQLSVDYIEKYGRLAAENFEYNEIRSAYNCGGLPLVLRLIDKRHTWDELRKVIPEIVAAGLCGYRFAVGDMIGGGDMWSFVPGYSVDERLFVRSCQVQALMPMMQFSLAPWRVLSAENCAICRDMAKLHVEFAPYILELAAECAKSGEPMVRAMEYAFPRQGFARRMQQFMLGDRYLVAPVTDEDDSVTVELPAGEWTDDLGVVHDGPKTIRLENVPLSRLPRFRREGIDEGR